MIARQSIYLSLNLPFSRKGEGFNVANEKGPDTWKNKWPQLCAYFGLKGTPPPADSSNAIEVRTYIRENFNIWENLEKKYNLRSGIADSSKGSVGFERWLLSDFDFDRQYDMTKMYGTGFTEERSVKDVWSGVFDRMRKGKQIP
jgi:hypothetical protein